MKIVWIWYALVVVNLWFAVAMIVITIFLTIKFIGPLQPVLEWFTPKISEKEKAKLEGRPLTFF